MNLKNVKKYFFVRFKNSIIFTFEKHKTHIDIWEKNVEILRRN